MSDFGYKEDHSVDISFPIVRYFVDHIGRGDGEDSPDLDEEIYCLGLRQSVRVALRYYIHFSFFDKII